MTQGLAPDRAELTVDLYTRSIQPITCSDPELEVLTSGTLLENSIPTIKQNWPIRFG